MKFKAIMFDLDGTLINSLADIAAATNYAMTHLGMPTHELPAFRYMVGQGLRSLMVDALGKDGQQHVEQGMALFTEYYKEHDAEQTVMYEGVGRMLGTLEKTDAKLAVLSNKPDPATKRVVQSFFGQYRWDAVRGAMDDVPIKPAPDGALAICDSLSIPPSDWAYIGDTKVDMATAVNAGLYPIGVTWGFRDEDELRENGAQQIVHSVGELTAYLTDAM